ncbi:hypothetical protein EAL2_c17720 [Peptoclostridium acidaminophilum DSM 3953]|uniref:Uncharacterized protein n=1 Tax=Peptoclostridium acidaminophilum DSM 3953 TaxID=1286171 RepID=W8TLJ8_PEPAC|nr:hypothetical protein [Peptoclostridium acidaminophilum]AHM57067.1 hypothetical protein EAL2_c17720 [Peptoclostridium acidaminophilum DSM 3953]
MNIDSLTVSAKTAKSINERYSGISFTSVSGKIEKIDECKTSVKLRSGSGTLYDVVLKNPILANEGDSVKLEKKDIKSISEHEPEKQKQERRMLEAENSRYARILRDIGIIPNEKNIEAAMRLERAGISITPSAVAEFIKVDSSIESIGGSITAQKAAILVESGFDIENMSLPELAEAIGALGEDRAGDEFIGKKEISTEEAEAIAKKLFGSRMGKDITDIIKALHIIGVEPSRAVVEEVKGAIYKLMAIEGSIERNAALLVAKNIEPTISNIYSIVSGIKNSAIEPSNKSLVSAYSAGFVYSAPPSDMHLEKLETDIRARLNDFGIQDSPGSIRICKEIIRLGLPLEKGLLAETGEILSSIGIVKSGLDASVAAAAVRAGMELEKTDIRDMARFVAMEQATAAKANEGMKEAVTPLSDSSKNSMLKELSHHQAMRHIADDFKTNGIIDRISLLVGNKGDVAAYAASQKGEMSFANITAMAMRLTGDSWNVAVLSNMSRSIGRMLRINDESLSASSRDDLVRAAGEISKIALKIKAEVLRGGMGQNEIDEIIKSSLEQIKKELGHESGGIKKIIEEAQKLLKDEEPLIEKLMTAGKILDIPAESAGMPLRVNIFIRDKKNQESPDIDPENVSLIIRIKNDAAQDTVLDVDIAGAAVDIRVLQGDMTSSEIALSESLIRRAVEDSGYMLSNVAKMEENKVQGEEAAPKGKLGIDAII